jgi:hypothetical protein
MKNQISKLTEKIVLQKRNHDISKTTVEMFFDIVSTRASITPINKFDKMQQELFEIIILKPPPYFKNTSINSIKWNNKEYQCQSAFKSCGDKFLKGVIAGKSKAK